MKIRPVTFFLPVFLVLALWCSSCSVKKNTAFSRTYHSLTTKYNVLFNGESRYTKAVRAIEESHRDDYSNLLPVFLSDDKEAARTLSGDMDYAIEKADKAILLHSIKAKPNLDRMRMTAEQRKFYNKKEYNVFLDNCYLLKGKAYFMRQDYYKAIETFEQMITLFPAERLLFETELWRIRALARDSRIPEAEKVARDLLDNEMRPPGRNYTRALKATLADVAIRGGKYEEAIPLLKEAAANAGVWSKEKQRYWYLLGQLHLLRNEQPEAMAYFGKISKRGSYEMSFNARLNIALSFTPGASGNKKDIQGDLERMLRDSRNKEYKDRIYYTLGEMERQDGQPGKALEYYCKSVASGIGNPSQKAVSALAAAQLFDTGRNYVQAVAYYDTAFLFLDPTLAAYAGLAQRAQVLSALTGYLEVIAHEDSVQRIALMPEGARLTLINQMVEADKEKVAQAARAESEPSPGYYSLRSSTSQAQTTGAGEWYFYNAAVLSRGISDFQMRWGRRTLEDDWRRKDRSLLSGTPDASGRALAAGGRFLAVRRPCSEFLSEGASPHRFSDDSLPIRRSGRLCMRLGTCIRRT